MICKCDMQLQPYRTVSAVSEQDVRDILAYGGPHRTGVRDVAFVPISTLNRVFVPLDFFEVGEAGPLVDGRDADGDRYSVFNLKPNQELRRHALNKMMPRSHIKRAYHGDVMFVMSVAPDGTERPWGTRLTHQFYRDTFGEMAKHYPDQIGAALYVYNSEDSILYSAACIKAFLDNDIPTFVREYRRSPK